MDISELVRLPLLLLHLLAFAVAAGYILREDLGFLRSGEIDPENLSEAGRVMTRALALLWATGIALVLVDTAGDLSVIASKPKLLAKLTVVSVLTINGVLLHCLAFPALTRQSRPLVSAGFVTIIGTVSTVSWIHAAFIGIANPVAKAMGYYGFISLYVLTLVFAIGFTMRVLQPRLERLLRVAPQADHRVA